jgi:hypothetical protein
LSAGFPAKRNRAGFLPFKLKFPNFLKIRRAEIVLSFAVSVKRYLFRF